MSQLTQADRYLLDQIRRGDAQAWSQLVGRYQGRLLAFARSRLGNAADAEDVVQETFMGFLRHLPRFREQAALETVLFAILRRRLVDWYRGRRLNTCLLQDVLSPDGPGASMDRFAAPEATASWYVRRDEQHAAHRRALSAAVRELVAGFKDSLNFRDLTIAELIFYGQLRNKDVARVAGVAADLVARVKHRCLERIRRRVRAQLSGGREDAGQADPAMYADALITEVWEDLRPSCPKRSTVGAYVLGTLEAGWSEYVDFHLHQLGCRFCLANLEDLRRQVARREGQALQRRIMKSTVGFLRRP